MNAKVKKDILAGATLLYTSYAVSGFPVCLFENGLKHFDSFLEALCTFENQKDAGRKSHIYVVNHYNCAALNRSYLTISDINEKPII